MVHKNHDHPSSKERRSEAKRAVFNGDCVRHITTRDFNHDASAERRGDQSTLADASRHLSGIALDSFMMNVSTGALPSNGTTRRRQR